MAVPTNEKTADGFESQFGTNHLAHFLLFQLLKPLLQSSSTTTFPSRVVNLSSSGHRAGGIHPEDYGLDSTPESYSPWAAYGQSKTANIYMANEIERRYGTKEDRPIHAWSLHPGGIMTGLQSHVPSSMKETWSSSTQIQNYMKSPAQGAATTIVAAVASGPFSGKGGMYLEDCDVSGPVPEGNESPLASGYAKHAYDEEKEKRLWGDSCRMVGVSAED